MNGGAARLEATTRVLTVYDVPLRETASSHTGIQVDSILFMQNGAVRTFVEHGRCNLAAGNLLLLMYGQYDPSSAQRFSLGPRHPRQHDLRYPGRRRRGEEPETAALGLP